MVLLLRKGARWIHGRKSTSFYILIHSSRSMSVAAWFSSSHSRPQLPFFRRKSAYQGCLHLPLHITRVCISYLSYNWQLGSFDYHVCNCPLVLNPINIFSVNFTLTSSDLTRKWDLTVCTFLLKFSPIVTPSGLIHAVINNRISFFFSEAKRYSIAFTHISLW